MVNDILNDDGYSGGHHTDLTGYDQISFKL